MHRLAKRRKQKRNARKERNRRRDKDTEWERDNTEVDKDGWRKRLNKDNVEIGKKLEKEWKSLLRLKSTCGVWKGRKERWKVRVKKS
jgi:hypothetical protein